MDWVFYFMSNRAERRPIPWRIGIAVEPHLRAPLIRSLQRFQVGEQGDGVHLQRGATATGDLGYTAAIALFIAEEQEHARMLARVLEGLGGTLLDGHWSDTCFILLRRALGLHHELLVLLIAEMIAKRYYRALFEGTEDTVLRAVFGQILQDEQGHVAFHEDTLRRAFAPLPTSARFFLRNVWRLLFAAACLVVAWDHRGVLRACGVPTTIFLRDCARIFHETARGIFAPASVALRETGAR